MPAHVLDVLTEATKMSLKKLKNVVKEKRDDGVLSTSKEIIQVEGMRKMINRVFVRLPSFREYANVGWVMHEDIDRCMTCSKKFWFFHTKKHCHACGNICCGDCASSFCLVAELPDQTHGVPVCALCDWGQDPVTAWLRNQNDGDSSKSSVKKTDSFDPRNGRVEHSADEISSITQTRKNLNIKTNEVSHLQPSPSSKSPKEKDTIRNLPSDKDDESSSSDEDDSLESRTVTPLFVIKTKRLQGNTKVFVNVCTLKDVDLVEAIKARNGLYINGLIPTEITDKSGELCVAYDVLINTYTMSDKYFDLDYVDSWIESAGGEIISMINTECEDNLDYVLKFPKIKGKYKGDEVRPYTDYRKELPDVHVIQKQDQNKNSSHMGWLKKQRRGGMIKNWKKRYFVLYDGELRYYEGDMSTPPYGVMEKGNMNVLGANIDDKEGLQFIVVGKAGVEKKNLVLEADNYATKNAWMKAIHENSFSK